MFDIRAVIPFILQTIIWIPTRIILNVFGHFEVSGLENLKNLKRKIIFASNHSSEMDPILLPASLPIFSRFMPIFYVSRKKEFYNREAVLKWLFYREWFFKLWGAYPTLPGKQDYENSLKTHISLINNNCSVFIFPEGKTTADGSILPAHGGVAYLSQKTGSLIIPVSISGVYKMRPSDLFCRRRKITLIFGAPVVPTTSNYKAEAQELMDIISKNLI